MISLSGQKQAVDIDTVAERERESNNRNKHTKRESGGERVRER